MGFEEVPDQVGGDKFFCRIADEDVWHKAYSAGPVMAETFDGHIVDLGGLCRFARGASIDTLLNTGCNANQFNGTRAL